MTTTGDRIADAWLDAMTVLCELTPHGWHAERGDARALVSGVGVGSLNIAVSTAREPGPDSLRSLDEAARDVAKHGLPWSIVVLGEAGADLAGLADRHGLTGGGPITVMVCDADRADLRAKPALIDRVGPHRSQDYTEVLAAGFETPAGIFGDLMGGGVLDDPRIAGYLTESATGLGIRTGGLIGVYNIAVRPEARSQGLGRAMTARVMADGFAAGATSAYLQTSTVGRPLYESMGFRTVQTWATFFTT
ncbi:ribosomal protein S18 acetylase RimI-like enzyme [Actinoplanes tereljensis]|uniref:N-acetyltransferase domain-containing protein n=1 Tax=Paractinoplanes tereljensis TaxID=571912 RepID=A0A919TV76_9ACTN|nr:GNAT family N-acetyltransferase [Actinoplanes tereljensis]GIF23631.1 hypothetical protein Ate02nite_63610 [Actinoplanes tereljensis]